MLALFYGAVTFKSQHNTVRVQLQGGKASETTAYTRLARPPHERTDHTRSTCTCETKTSELLKSWYLRAITGVSVIAAAFADGGKTLHHTPASEADSLQQGSMSITIGGVDSVSLHAHRSNRSVSSFRACPGFLRDQILH